VVAGHSTAGRAGGFSDRRVVMEHILGIDRVHRDGGRLAGEQHIINTILIIVVVIDSSEAAVNATTETAPHAMSVSLG